MYSLLGIWGGEVIIALFHKHPFVQIEEAPVIQVTSFYNISKGSLQNSTGGSGRLLLF